MDEEQERCDICDVDHIALDDTCEDHEEDRRCERCGEVVHHLLSEDGLCDACSLYNEGRVAL